MDRGRGRLRALQGKEAALKAEMEQVRTYVACMTVM